MEKSTFSTTHYHLAGARMGLKERAFIGLDLGGTFLKYALGKGDGTILRSGKLPSNGSQSADAIFSVMFQAIAELLEAAEK
ncbi:MAG TPA: hypothetical protein PLZ01_13000, partial [bacterium]|nr:hypothetical protein [bacterium]